MASIGAQIGRRLATARIGPDQRRNAFAQHWSAFIEYNYLDFGTKAANSTHFLSLPIMFLPLLLFRYRPATERFNIVKVGVNYRFNWLGL